MYILIKYNYKYDNLLTRTTHYSNMLFNRNSIMILTIIIVTLTGWLTTIVIILKELWA